MITEITKPTTRPMKIDDIPFLVLEHDWLRDVFYDFFDQGRGPAWVLEDGEGLIAAFGATILWPGTCEVWFSLVRSEKNITMLRMAKRFLDDVQSKFGISRFHAAVSDEIGKKFVEFFGFECETPNGMKSYNPDSSTAWLYSRIL